MANQFMSEAPTLRPPPNERLDAQFQEVLQTVTGAEELKQEAIKIGVQAHSAKQMAAVEAYLFWREAQKVEGYLAKLYAEKGIVQNSLKRNGVNFNPFVKLVYGHLRKDAAWTANMAKSLNAIDDEYVRDPAIYRSDPADRLYNWVASNRGLSGIRSKATSLDTETEEEPVTPPKKERGPSSKAKYQSPPTEIRRAILQKHTDQLVSTKGTVLPIADVPLSRDNSAMTDLVVLLARRDANGSISCIGSTSDRVLVESAVTRCVRFDHERLSPILATLVECLQPHCVPREVVTRGMRRKWFNEHRVLTSDAGDLERRAESVRLVIKTDGVVMISKVYAQASFTTISTPKLMDLASDETLALRGSDRSHIERRLLLDSHISLYKSEPTDGLKDVDSALVAHLQRAPAKALTLRADEWRGPKIKNPPTNRVIYFQNYAEANAPQPTIKARDSITYDWKMTATKAFFSKFYARGLSTWLSYMNGGLGAPGNVAFNLIFARDHIELQSKWMRDKKSWDRTAAVDPDCSTAFGADASIKFANEDAVSASVIAHPHDLVELMSYLSSANLIGPVTIQGNDSLLHLSWETAVAKHEAWIPSSNFQGHRCAKHFEVFGDE